MARLYATGKRFSCNFVPFVVKEIVSLILVAAAVVVIAVLFQMDYGIGRQWLTWLALATVGILWKVISLLRQ